VHGADLYAQRPAGVGYGTPLGELADITFQKKTWIALQDITRNPFDNFLRLHDFATRAGLKHLTCDVVGGTILIYSTMGTATAKKLILMSKWNACLCPPDSKNGNSIEDGIEFQSGLSCLADRE
jgi:hypothetical protein